MFACLPVASNIPGESLFRITSKTATVRKPSQLVIVDCEPLNRSEHAQKHRTSFRSPHSPLMRSANQTSTETRDGTPTQVTDVSFELPTMGQINFTQVYATSDTHAEMIHVSPALYA